MFWRRPEVHIHNNVTVGAAVDGEQVEQLLASMTQLTEGIDMLDLTALTQEVAETRGAVNSAVVVFTAQRGEIATLQQQLADARAALTAEQAENADLVAALDGAQATADGLAASLNEGQADLVSAIGENDDNTDTETPDDGEPVDTTPGDGTGTVEPDPSSEVPGTTETGNGTTPEIPGEVDGETPAPNDGSSDPAEPGEGTTVAPGEPQPTDPTEITPNNGGSPDIHIVDDQGEAPVTETPTETGSTTEPTDVGGNETVTGDEGTVPAGTTEAPVDGDGQPVTE